MISETPTQQLKLKSVMGFSGSVPQGFLLHPKKSHQIYPLGSNIVIQNIENGKQEFLQGHNNLVLCLAVSKSGEYIASGQVTHMGFQVKHLFYLFIFLFFWLNSFY
ncbi:Cilia- and flagella-associated protein 52 [Coelomomyces lativittatus]|nr:Cilia- and flagella-associated protein 52 [Coelomomyces lativittatus]KAJ1509698.1 Cilia- and flagella-associated protein 52 [Coelomomyces lativittatus]